MAIHLNTTYAEAFINRRTVKTEFKHYTDAVMDFTRAIDINPKDYLAFVNSETVYMTHFKDNQKACDDWKRACELGHCKNYKMAKRRSLCK